MADPDIAQRAPIAVDLEAGKSYFWCACWRSKTQPFCDGSHKGTEFAPVKYAADASKRVFFCCCKHTRTPPFCDGSHKTV